MTEEPRPVEDDALREAAIKRLKERADFRVHATVYLAVNSFLIALWAMTGRAFFWPVFPLFGWGIGLAAHAASVYGQARLTEDRIHREMDRMRENR